MSSCSKRASKDRVLYLLKVRPTSGARVRQSRNGTNQVTSFIQTENVTSLFLKISLFGEDDVIVWKIDAVMDRLMVDGELA